jgi:protein-export membrane protein SecD
MSKYRIGSAVLILALIFLGFFVYTTGKANSPLGKFPFKFGLDLVGGTELIYKADVSQVAQGDITTSMDALRDVIERRVNVFGVSEPIIQVEEAGLISGNKDHRLIVELPGVTDIDKAVALIGETPLLEFRLQNQDLTKLTKQQIASSSANDLFSATGITGRLLSRAVLQFNSTTQQPIVVLEFNSEGKDLFAKVTRENIGKVLGIFLDGNPISLPTVRDEISNGSAQITGGFTPEEAKLLVRNLNYGALPVPIELISTESVGASLGEVALNAGVKAGLVGLVLTIIFLILWYRLPGLVASVALVLYVFISLSLFKLIPVTLTAAGLAGFILSIGMAVDANILIFERMKEELKKGKALDDSIHEGFHRAWLSIRDSNISSIITAIVLFWLGTSSVKGFALTLGLGVLVSMFTAITATRSFLFALGFKGESKSAKFLFGAGTHNSQ